MANINYYLNLVTSEHRDKINFITWLTAALQQVDDITTLTCEIDQDFDIDTATGVQLDTLGVIIGQGRKVNFQPSDGSSPVLTDSFYRLLLKAKIVHNQWKGKINEFVKMWGVLFPASNLIIRDNQDMTMDIIIPGNLSLLERDLVRYGYISPKPQGVKVNYYFGDFPMFAYDIDNDYFAGYDKGTWAKTQEVTIFGYDVQGPQIAGYDTGWWSN